MTNHFDRSVWPKAFAGLAGIFLFALCIGVGAGTTCATYAIRRAARH
jgi:hypothetical protein